MTKDEFKKLSKKCPWRNVNYSKYAARTIPKGPFCQAVEYRHCQKKNCAIHYWIDINNNLWKGADYLIKNEQEGLHLQKYLVVDRYIEPICPEAFVELDELLSGKMGGFEGEWQLSGIEWSELENMHREAEWVYGPNTTDKMVKKIIKYVENNYKIRFFYKIVNKQAEKEV